MWLITNFGFFSIVKKPGDGAALTIRARVRDDLEWLRDSYLPSLSEIVAGGGTDYPFRARASASAVASALAKAVQDIDYSNFKDAATGKLGTARGKVYGRVWSALFDLTSSAPKAKPKVLKQAPRTRTDLSGHSEEADAYGGVIFDDEGRVLLREPTGHYDGYVWTFCKGGPESRETAEATAIRETRQESGVPVEIVARIPGKFRGGMGTNIYFLMKPVGPTGKPDWETARVIWVTSEDAKTRINETTNVVGRTRDLAVLAAAVEVYRNLTK